MAHGPGGRRRAVREAFPIVCAAVLAPSLAGQEPAEPGVAVSLEGFIGAGVFVQDALFAPGNGQQAQLVAPSQDGPEGWWHGGDVRNTRLAVALSGPAPREGWRLGGRLEFDLFGGLTVGSGYDQEQLLPRMRLAYLGVESERSSLRIGQDWAPLYLHVPTSVTHVAFPLGYGSAGLIGWRFPGIFADHRLVDDDRLAVTLRGAIMRGGWKDGAPPPNSGQATLLPQLELRLDVERAPGEGPAWEVFAAGHFDRKEIDFDPARELDGWAVAVSGRIEPDPLTLQGGGYAGRAVGQHAAHISQFGDIGGYGAWIQIGYALRDRWSVWGFAGTDDPDDDDLTSGHAVRNRMGSLMLSYEAGPLELGLEWLGVRTTRRGADGAAGFRDRTRSGGQLALGALLSF